MPTKGYHHQRNQDRAALMNHPTWILQQTSKLVDDQIVWIAEDVLRVDQTAAEMIFVLYKSEGSKDWDIVVANNETYKMYANSFEAFVEEQIEEEESGMKLLETLNGGTVTNVFEPLQKVGRTKIAGQPATEYIISQSWTAPNYSWKNEYHAWFADDISLSPESGLPLIYMLGHSLHHDRALLRLSLKDEILLDTLRVERKDIPQDKLIALGDDYDEVDSYEDVETQYSIEEASASMWPGASGSNN